MADDAVLYDNPKEESAYEIPAKQAGSSPTGNIRFTTISDVATLRHPDDVETTSTSSFSKVNKTSTPNNMQRNNFANIIFKLSYSAATLTSIILGFVILIKINSFGEVRQDLTVSGGFLKRMKQARNERYNTDMELSKILRHIERIYTTDIKILNKTTAVDSIAKLVQEDVKVVGENVKAMEANVDVVIENDNEIVTEIRRQTAVIDDIDERLENVETSLLANNNQAYMKTDEITQQNVNLKKRVSNPCPSDGVVGYSGDCFFAVFDAQRVYSDAEQVCNSLDSRAADVDSEMLLERLILHLQLQVERRGWRTGHLWLGMTFSPDSGTARYSNGTEATVQRWATSVWSSLPFMTSQSSSYADCTRMLLMVDSSQSYTSAYNGFANHSPAYGCYVLCQRSA